MLQQILQKTILATAMFNAPLLFSRLYRLDWYRATLQEWVARLELEKGAKILELGCGPGNLTASLADMNFRVVGADKSPAMIAQARKIETGARFVQADALDLPMQAQEFDVVLLASLINLVPDRALLLQEAARVLKPGGVISVLFPTPGFNREKAENIAARRRLSPYSAAAMSVWAGAARKLDPKVIADEFAQAGLENPSTALHLEDQIASVTATTACTL